MPMDLPPILAGRFDWLPTIEKCCFFIPLNIGVILIGIYGVLRSHDGLTHLISVLFFSKCPITGVNILLTLILFLVAAAGFAFFCGSVILLFMMCMDFHLTKVYVVGSVVFILLNFTFWLTSAIVFWSSGANACQINRTLYSSPEHQKRNLIILFGVLPLMLIDAICSYNK